VELHLLSALRNKSFTSPRALLMSQSAVPHAARQGNQGVMETAITDPDARCFPQHAPSAVKIPKYPLNLAMIDLFIVEIATVKLD